MPTRKRTFHERVIEKITELFQVFFAWVTAKISSFFGIPIEPNYSYATPGSTPSSTSTRSTASRDSRAPAPPSPSPSVKSEEPSWAELLSENMPKIMFFLYTVNEAFVTNPAAAPFIAYPLYNEMFNTPGAQEQEIPSSAGRRGPRPRPFQGPVEEVD